MTREGTGVPEWWWSVLLSFIPINPDNRPAICGHLKTGSQYRGLLSKWWNQILHHFFYIIHSTSELKCQLRVVFLCVIVTSHLHPRWPGWCHDPHVVRGSAIEWAWPWTIVAITALWHREPTPGVECPQGLARGHLAGYSPARWSTGQLRPTM